MKDLIERITGYLTNGGFFNPELMEADKVRELLIDCRTALTASEAAREKLEQTGASFLADVDCLCDWLNAQDISADHAESKPEDFDRLCDSMTEFRATLYTSEAHHG